MKAILKSGIRRVIGTQRYAKAIDRVYEARADLDALRVARKEIEPWKNRFEGEHCWIFGNGPSLNKMDLELFKNEKVWFSNKAYLLFPRISWRPTFYIATDERTILDMADDFREIVTQHPEIAFFSPSHHLKRAGVEIRENVYRPRIHLSKCAVGETDPKEMLKYFSGDCGRIIYLLKTVTATSMQLAVHMGFKRIYLVGCDANYQMPPGVRHLHPDAKEEDMARHVVSTDDNDTLHFDKRYFRKGSSWTLPNPDLQMLGYRIGKLGCERHGVQVYNAGIDSQLEVFPRVDYREVLASGSPAKPLR